MVQPMREMGRDACRHLFAAIGRGGERREMAEYAMTLTVRESLRGALLSLNLHLSHA